MCTSAPSGAAVASFTRLFDHLPQLARARPDIRSLRLYMHADNARARLAYERLGMKRTKYEVFEMSWNPETGRRLRRRLCGWNDPRLAVPNAGSDRRRNPKPEAPKSEKDGQST